MLSKTTLSFLPTIPIRHPFSFIFRIGFFEHLFATMMYSANIIKSPLKTANITIKPKAELKKEKARKTTDATNDATTDKTKFFIQSI